MYVGESLFQSKSAVLCWRMLVGCPGLGEKMDRGMAN